MPLNFLHAQKRLTTLPALCWVEHEGCGHENLQQSQHHPDPAPVTSPHKNVVFLLLYLDVELRALTGLHVLKASCLGQGHAEALLQADWKVTQSRTSFMSSWSNLSIPTTQHPGKDICLQLLGCHHCPRHKWLPICLFPRCSLESCLLAKRLQPNQTTKASNGWVLHFLQGSV